MKLWEVFKEWETHPRKIFIYKDPNYGTTTLISLTCGMGRWPYLYKYDASGELISGVHFNGNVELSYEWVEQKKSVTWQKAVEAWANGKVVEINFPGKERRISDKVDLFCISSNDILNGKWYIEEENS